MNEKKDFNPERDIEFSIVSKLKKKEKKLSSGSDHTAPVETTLTTTGLTNVGDGQYRRGLFFDYNSTYFKELLQSSTPPFLNVVLKDLTALTQALKTPAQQSLFINWGSNPKAYEQLLPQISSKFPSIPIIMLDYDLNPQKMQELKQRYPFVKHFLSIPLSIEDIKTVLKIS